MCRLIKSVILVHTFVIFWSVASFGASGTIEDKVKRIIVEESLQTDVPTSLAMAIAKTSSAFRPDFEGQNGARGVMQILPETAEAIGVDPETLWKPRENIKLGLRVISNLLKRTSGNWINAITTFNAQRLPLNSNVASRNVADTLHWERRFAEQLALQDPVHRRRQEVIVGEVGPPLENNDINNYKDDEISIEKKTTDKRFSKHFYGLNPKREKSCHRGFVRDLSKGIINNGFGSISTQIIEFELNNSSKILVKEWSTNGIDDDIQVIIITDIESEGDLTEAPITPKLIWEPYNRVRRLIERSQRHKILLDQLVTSTNGDW